MDHRGNTAGDSVLDKLNQGAVILSFELAKKILHSIFAAQK
jgi:hypothetical protein